jgi:hypothetical protein
MKWTYHRPAPEATEQWARRYTAPGGWTIEKEWYADGPSMFSWVLTLTHPDGTVISWTEHPTLAAAKAAALSHPTHTIQP